MLHGRRAKRSPASLAWIETDDGLPSYISPRTLNPKPTITATPSNTSKKCPSILSRKADLHMLDKLPFSGLLALGEMFKLCPELNHLFANLGIIDRRGPSLQRIGPCA